MNTHEPQSAPQHLAKSGRILALDLARTAALVAMAVFHFVFDLELFGHVPRGTSFLTHWRWLAFLTAGSFLFLVGVSLWLAHGQGIRWRGFGRRLIWIVAAALVITAGSFVAMRESFIFFGILHAIALSSVLGLLALRLPAWLLVPLGALVLWLPQVWRSELLSEPWLWWLGLQAVPVRSVDFVPIFPWFGPVLLGIAFAKILGAAGIWSNLGAWEGGPLVRYLAWPGQHSLLVYLLHQPILIAGIWTVGQLV